MKSMMNRVAAFAACKAFLAKQKVNEAVDELKSDERGLSGTVVAILLILVAVLAVVMIWKFLKGYLENVQQRITDADTI